MAEKIFLSYSSKDREAVTVLASDLEKLGFTVWFDQALHGGQEWWAGILENIRKCDVFVFAVTSKALDSKPCELERDYATRVKRRILPVLLEKVNLWRMPADLQKLQYVDYTERNHATALNLAGAILQLPPKKRLPNPLPPEPAAPLQGVPAEELLSGEANQAPFVMRKSGDKPDPADSVRFSVYYPQSIPPDQWVSLRAYVYRPTGLRVVDETEYRRLTQYVRHVETRSYLQVEDGMRLAVLPEVSDVVFNPPDPSLYIYEPTHVFPIKMRVASKLEGQRLKGHLRFMVGPLIVEETQFVMDVRRPGSPPEPLAVSSAIGQSIYVCYAHTDAPIAQTYLNALKVLGIEVANFDTGNLRAGEDWKEALQRAMWVTIDRADIFQLFWSPAAARSKDIEAQWRYALSIADQKGPNFIRAVYWERNPMPPIPPELAHLHFAYYPLGASEK